MQEVAYGLCQCGCGQPTSIPAKSSRKQGRVKGVPMRYVVGHANRGKALRTGPDWVVEDRGYLTPCRIWQHQITAGGYGRATVPGGGGQEYTHRLAWVEAHGPIPKGMHLDHLCRVRACGNVDHLEVVTPAENSRRGTAGAGGRERQTAKTTCPRGHEYAGENLYVSKDGKRHCKTCRREALRASRARRKAA